MECIAVYKWFLGKQRAKLYNQSIWVNTPDSGKVCINKEMTKENILLGIHLNEVTVSLHRDVFVLTNVNTETIISLIHVSFS